MEYWSIGVVECWMNIGQRRMGRVLLKDSTDPPPPENL